MGNGSTSEYRILVSRGDCRPNATLYAFGVRQAIPTFPLPLNQMTRSPLWTSAGSCTPCTTRRATICALDYIGEPHPSLSAADAPWADQLLRQQGLR